MSDVNKIARPDAESLDWLAFRYVSGEMTDSEQSDFEARLNSDSESFSLAACEAVARTVQLGDIVVAAFDAASESVEPIDGLADSRADSPSRKPAFGRDIVARRASIAASTVAVIAAGWMFTSSDPDRLVEIADVEDGSMVTADTETAGEMVRFWADSDSEFDLDGDERLLTAADVPDTLSADVPDWLLAAVESQQVTGDTLSEPEVLEN